MEKEQECKFNTKKGESETKKLGKKKDVEEKPLKRCKDWCIEMEGVACGYDAKARMCTVYKSGFKGVSVSECVPTIALCANEFSSYECLFYVCGTDGRSLR
jgi:hypothetical protein